MVPERGFEPLSPKAADFESAVYTVPPLWLSIEYVMIIFYCLKLNNFSRYINNFQILSTCLIEMEWLLLKES